MARLERLAQRLERGPRELGELVEEENAVVGEGDLTRPRHVPAADQAGGRDRVVGSPERTLGRKPAVAKPDHALDTRDLDRLFVRRRRQDPRHAPREHRLADARWADHEDVVAAGGRDLERSPRVGLAAHVRQVRAVLRALRRRRGARRRRAPPPREQVDHPAHARNAQDLEALHQRRLGRVLDRDDQALEGGTARSLGDSDRARYRAERAAQRELAAQGDRREAVARDLIGRREEGDREREVEARARLAQVGRGEVCGYPLERELESRVLQRGAHTLARLAHRRIGQPDDGEHGEASPRVDLDGDLPALDSLDGEGGDTGEHEATLRRRDRHVGYVCDDPATAW